MGYFLSNIYTQYLLSLPSNLAVAGNARSAELTAEALTSYCLPSGEAAQLSLASCRIDLLAGRTKSYVKLYICEALEKDIDELFELIMNCPKTAELVSKMLAPPLREAI